MGSEKFCLRWNDFESNISSAFRELRDDKDFFDVTIACDDEQIQAHKVILSACSPFFRNILRRNPHQHPLLYLKGVKYTDLQSVLNFMYHGEVNVAQEELNSFLAVAEDLRVKGLTQNQSGGTAKKDPPPNLPPPVNKTSSRSYEREHIPPPKRSRPVPPATSNIMSEHQVEEEIQELVPVKSEPRDTQAAPPTPAVDQYQAHPHPVAHTSHALTPAADDQALAYQEENYEEEYQYGEDQGYEGAAMGEMEVEANKGFLATLNAGLDVEIESFLVSSGGGLWQCGECGKQGSKADVKRHIEAKHMLNTKINCPFCGKSSKTRDSLRKHLKKDHDGIWQ